jgi:iron complex transport system substrate-binding protein
MNQSIEELSAEVVDAAYHLHVGLGPGLLESVYEVVLCRELERRGLRVERQKPIPIVYAGQLKSVEALHPVHGKQVLTYLRLLNLPLGLLINFGAPTFKEGIRRIVNNHTDFASSRLRVHESDSREDAKARREEKNG